MCVSCPNQVKWSGIHIEYLLPSHRSCYLVMLPDVHGSRLDVFDSLCVSVVPANKSHVGSRCCAFKQLLRSSNHQECVLQSHRRCDSGTLSQIHGNGLYKSILYTYLNSMLPSLAWILALQSVMQCVAVRCSAVQFVAGCCSVLQCLDLKSHVDSCESWPF